MDLRDKLGLWIRAFLSGTEDGTITGTKHVAKTDAEGRLEIVGSFGYTFSDPLWHIDGYLASGTQVRSFICPRSGNISAVYLYLEYCGTAVSTIVDVNLNGVTIFTTQANRPTVPFNSSSKWHRAVPDIVAVEAGDILTLDIDLAADGPSRTATVVVAMTGPSGGAFEAYLNDLLDVDAGSPADGQVLAWDAGASEWVPVTVSGAGHTHVESEITDLDHDAVKLQGRDLAATAPADGEILIWNDTATEWQPGGVTPGAHTHTEADITDLDHDAVKLQGNAVGTAAPADGNVLIWNAGASEYQPGAQLADKTIAAQMLFAVEGANLDTTGDRAIRVYSFLDTGVTGTVVKVFAYVGTAPSTTALRIQVKKNGTGIITAGYVEVAVSANTGQATAFDDTDIEDGDYWTFDVVQGDAAAADLTLHVQYEY